MHSVYWIQFLSGFKFLCTYTHMQCIYRWGGGGRVCTYVYMYLCVHVLMCACKTIHVRQMKVFTIACESSTCTRLLYTDNILITCEISSCP